MEVSVVVECRETKSGAFTSVTKHDPGVVVEQFNSSKTGRHWKERVTGPVGARFYVADVTNSGKDRSAWRTLPSSGKTDEFDAFCQELGIVQFRKAFYHQLKSRGIASPDRQTLEREWAVLVKWMLRDAGLTGKE